MKNREFWVLTVVDFAVSVAVGVAAAAVVAGMITLAAGTAIGTFLAAPAAAILVTAGVAWLIGYGLDALQVSYHLKVLFSGGK